MFASMAKLTRMHCKTKKSSKKYAGYNLLVILLLYLGHLKNSVLVRYDNQLKITFKSMYTRT